MILKRAASVACLLMLMGAASIAAAQNPFVGSWKLNPKKSHFAGATMKFSPAEGQSIEIASGGTTYSFRVDGKDYRMASGDLAVWKQTGSATWTTEYRNTSGKLLDTDMWKLSADGQTLTVVTAGARPDGEKYSDSATYARTAGASGLLGSWKRTGVELSSPIEVTIGSYGLGGLSIKIAALKTSFVASFDGKDVTPSGPDIPPGLTVAFARTGPSSFRFIKKIDGSAVYSSVFTVSADGQTMTAVGNARGDPSQTTLWEKQ